MATQKTCLQCGKLFSPWRKKAYCSEKCRKQAENLRLRGDKTPDKGMIPEGENSEKIDEQNQGLPDGMRGYEWSACNDVTDRFAKKGGDAVGWTMKIEGKGWFGRVRKEMSFGPTSRTRARQAVEVFLKGEPFAKNEDEHSWRGDCWRLVSGI